MSASAKSLLNASPAKADLWVHDRTCRTLPLARESAAAVVADFAPDRGPALGHAQAILRALYRQGSWLSCGCREGDAAPLWALAARDDHVHLRQITPHHHAPDCPFHQAPNGGGKEHRTDPISARTELRKNRWKGPLRVLHPRHPGDADSIERLADGRRVRRAHLLQRLLRDQLVSSGMTRLPMEGAFFSPEYCRSPLRIGKLEHALGDNSAIGVLRWPASAPRVSTWSTGFLVLFVADTLTPRLIDGGLHTECARHKGPSVTVRGHVQIDASLGGEGPWVVLGVLRRDEPGAPAYMEAVAVPVLHTSLLFPINDSAERAPFHAVFHAVHVAHKQGVTGVVLRALPFNDPEYPELVRDGTYVLERPAAEPIVLSRLPLPGAIDLTTSRGEIFAQTIRRLHQR